MTDLAEHAAGDQDGGLPLSVAIVCKNNEATIGRTLESVRGLAGQIVAVDSGSTDGTLDLLAESGAQITRSEWLGYVKTKQLAFTKCTRGWVLFLDSDESLEPKLRESIGALIRRDDPQVAGAEVNRKVWWGGAWLNHAWQPEWRLRLVRRGAAQLGGREPHDAVCLTAEAAASRVVRLEGDLRHDTVGSVGDFLRAQVHLAEMGAAALHEEGRRGRVAHLVTSPAAAWIKQMIVKSAWRDGWRGWCAASVSACASAMKHMALLEIHRSEHRGDG